MVQDISNYFSEANVITNGNDVQHYKNATKIRPKLQ